MPALKTISKSFCKFTIPIMSNVKSFKVKANGSFKLHHRIIDIEVQYGRIIATKYGQLILDYDLVEFLSTSEITSKKNARYVSDPNDARITLDAIKFNHCKITINQDRLPELKISIGSNVVIKSFCNNLQIIVNDQLVAECVLYNGVDDNPTNGASSGTFIDAIKTDDFKDRFYRKGGEDFEIYGSLYVLDDKQLIHYTPSNYKDTIIGTFGRIDFAVDIKNDLQQKFIQLHYYDEEDVHRVLTYIFDKDENTYKVIDNLLDDNMFGNHNCCDIHRFYKKEEATGEFLEFFGRPYTRHLGINE